jgi:aspartyl-tRNA(Asn)/glutamyl-tRNA(Gln) amidotransferase subunit A
LKPTYGRVSLRGVVPLSWNMDHIGPITRSVKDAALLLEILAGYDPGDPVSVDRPAGDFLFDIAAGISGWKVALAAGDYIESIEPHVLDAFHTAAGVFADLGAIVTEVVPPDLREAAAANGKMVIADAAAFHRERLNENPGGFGPDVRERLEAGRAVTSTEYSLTRRVQSEMKHAYARFFDEYDLLLLPTTAVTAPPIENMDSAAYAPKLTRFTAPFNLTGLPALSLPCGFSPDGLPIGLQIVGKAWDEKKVLRAGFAYEGKTDWGRKRPPF